MILHSSFRARIAPFVLAAAVAACGGYSSGPVNTQPDASAKQAVTNFMQAVADSNLTKIAELWGSSKGPVSATRPPRFEERVVLIQSYLRHDDYKITNDVAAGSDRSMQVVIRRQACTWTVPFTVTRAGPGWLVSNVDLTKAGNPVRPCDPNAQGDSTLGKP